MSESTKLLLEWHEEYPLATFDEIANELEAKDAEIARLRDINKRARETIDSALKETNADKFVAENYRLRAALEKGIGGEMSDLIERLRFKFTHHHSIDQWQLCQEAADALEAMTLDRNAHFQRAERACKERDALRRRSIK
jgi:hypothetical protein